MKKVMAFGTFDILHPGHEYFLKSAKKMGDYLVVVVARDTNVKRFKKSKPLNNEKTRLNNLKKLDIADKVRLGYVSNVYKVIVEEKPDIIALGYDQMIFVPELRKKFGKQIQIKRLKSFKSNQYKSSRIRYAGVSGDNK